MGLLSLKGDPNAQDIDGETPLHYAAIAGCADAARLLLKYGADLEVANWNAEVPLDLAELNLAYFLGVDTAAVQEVLRSFASDPDSVSPASRVHASTTSVVSQSSA